MNKEDKVNAVVEFLKWLEDYTCYEVGEEVYSDYGDGESTFHRCNNEILIAEFRNWICEG